ncbi:MAG: TIGR03085 family protein [Micropruina sp.]|nr:TIGR03085 family protein [Micropruina sp.]
MRRAQTERAHLCDALAAAGPGAPTLCEGWTAYDLAAHVWLRENDLIGGLGYAIPALADRTERRAERLKRERGFAGLVDAIRTGPPRFSLFRLPAADEAANAAEFLIHGLDVRRPNGLPEPERPAAFDDWAWSQLRLAKLMTRGLDVGLVLEWDGRPDRSLRVTPGARTVTVIGAPVELMLYAFGRRAAADVRLVGLPEALAALER